eukprot:scaffold23520_cov19-Tisochrysis_lutea.AAC.1
MSTLLRLMHARANAFEKQHESRLPCSVMYPFAAGVVLASCLHKSWRRPITLCKQQMLFWQSLIKRIISVEVNFMVVKSSVAPAAGALLAHIDAPAFEWKAEW